MNKQDRKIEKILKGREAIDKMRKEMRQIAFNSLTIREFDEKTMHIWDHIQKKSNSQKATHTRDEWEFWFLKERHAFVKFTNNYYL